MPPGSVFKQDLCLDINIWIAVYAIGSECVGLTGLK